MSATADAVRDAAELRARGFTLCKPDPGEKKPTYEGWSTRSLEPGDFAADDLIGIQGGALSDGNLPGHSLIIIDLDRTEAIEKADDFLPVTAMEEGREGKRRDHRYFLVPNDTIPDWAVSHAEQGAPAALTEKGHAGPAKKAFSHAVTKERVIDFIGTGGQCVCPGGSGVREWEGGSPGEPTVVPFPELWDAVCRLAEACGCKLPGKNGTAHKPFLLQVRDNLTERALAYLAECEPAVSGQCGHNATLYAARAMVYGFDLGETEGLRLLLQHYNQRCVPPWTENELAHKCHDADRLPFDKPRGWLRDADNRQQGGKKAADGIPIGPLVLVPGKPRQTPSGKIVIPVRLLRDGQAFDQVEIMTSVHGRKQSSALLRDRTKPATEAEVERVVEQIIAAALERLDRQETASREGDDLRTKVQAHVDAKYRPRHRVGRRVWLDGIGELIDRAAFVHLLNNDLLATARAASDVGEGEDRYILAARVEAELRLLFGDLLQGLPDKRTKDTPLHPTEREDLAQAIQAMFTLPAMLTKTRNPKDNTEVTRSVSLIEQVKELVRSGEVQPGRWQQIHPAHAAYVTAIQTLGEGGEVATETVLGFNAELATSTRVRLPDGISNFNLKKIGKKAELFRDLDGVSDRADRSTVRLIVLSARFASFMLVDATTAELSSPAKPSAPEASTEDDEYEDEYS